MFSVKSASHKTLTAALLVLGMSLAGTAHAGSMIDKIHFIIPGGAGGGWGLP